jgi:hypothetical protein
MDCATYNLEKISVLSIIHALIIWLRMIHALITWFADDQCTDYLVCGLSVHDHKLLIINDERGEITWYSAECSNIILNTEIGNFRAYS